MLHYVNNVFIFKLFIFYFVWKNEKNQRFRFLKFAYFSYLEQDSCLAAKVFISNYELQVLQILVTQNGHIKTNRFFRGMEWSAIRMSLKASSNIKVTIRSFKVLRFIFS